MKDKIQTFDFINKSFSMFFKNNLLSNAAEMAYFLVFAFFPLLMVVHASFSMALQNFNIKNTFFYTILPDMVESLIDTYIEHISTHSNLSFLFLGIILTIFTLSNFMKSIKRAIRKLYKSETETNHLTEISVSLVFSVLILAAFYGSLILLVLGKQIIMFLQKIVPTISNLILQSALSIIFTSVIIFTVVSLIYYFLPNVKLRFLQILPGSITTTISWILISWGFSFYMNNFSSYSVIYGSIGAFIILMLWIYISCIVLLSGSVINATIYLKSND